MKSFKTYVKWQATALLLVLALMFGVSQYAHATGDTARIVVTLPTQYDDDSALPVTDIAEVRLQWFRRNSSILIAERSVSPAQLTFDLPGLKCGDYDFKAFVLTNATAKFPNTGGKNVAETPYATGVACSPKAPGLTVQ